MPCESCAVQFSVFKRKRACCECERYYCSACLRRGGGAMCAPCRVLSTRPLSRQTIAHLKVRDLQCFLQRQNVSTRGCVEKEELVSLCVSHVNSASYRRRGSRAGSSPFSSLKGLTNNINVFINSAFDLRGTPQSAQPAPPPPNRQYTSSCYNSSHAHSSPTNNTPTSPPRPQPERFTTRPGGEADVHVAAAASGAVRSPSAESARVDSADCFEIEDLDEAGWEFVNRPADPLPNDSDVLLSTSEAEARRGRNSVGDLSEARLHERVRERPSEPARERVSEQLGERLGERLGDRLSERLGERLGDRLSDRLGERLGELTNEHRAASELQLRTDEPDSRNDSTSLQDEPLSHHEDTGSSIPLEEIGDVISLEQVKSASELERLSVRQLKALLARNRVQYSGCLERRDLLDRATMLWNDYAQYKDEVDKLPIEECCKICMAAPLECVLLECGHIAACTTCSKQLAECPICRQYVVRAVRFFRS